MIPWPRGSETRSRSSRRESRSAIPSAARSADHPSRQRLPWGRPSHSTIGQGTLTISSSLKVLLHEHTEHVVGITSPRYLECRPSSAHNDGSRGGLCTENRRETTGSRRHPQAASGAPSAAAARGRAFRPVGGSGGYRALRKVLRISELRMTDRATSSLHGTPRRGRGPFGIFASFRRVFMGTMRVLDAVPWYVIAAFDVAGVLALFAAVPGSRLRQPNAAFVAGIIYAAAAAIVTALWAGEQLRRTKPGHPDGPRSAKQRSGPDGSRLRHRTFRGAER